MFWKELGVSCLMGLSLELLGFPWVSFLLEPHLVF